MKKILITISIVLVFIMSLSVISFADIRNDLSGNSYVQYQDYCSEYNKVVSLFPDVSLPTLQSYDEFSKQKKIIEYNDSDCNLLDSYEKVIDGNYYLLEVYDNGSFALASAENTRYSGSAGLDDDSTPWRMYWQWFHVDGYHQVYVNVYRIYDSATETYYFRSPAVFGDVTFAILVSPVSLYRSGSAMNKLTYVGDVFDYDDFGLGVEYYHFRLTLTATVDMYDGIITVGFTHD